MRPKISPPTTIDTLAIRIQLHSLEAEGKTVNSDFKVNNTYISGKVCKNSGEA